MTPRGHGLYQHPHTHPYPQPQRLNRPARNSRQHVRTPHIHGEQPGVLLILNDMNDDPAKLIPNTQPPGFLDP